MTRADACGEAVPFRVAAPARDILGESPLWSAREARVYWVDVRGPALNRLDPLSGELERWALPEVVAAVFLRERGGVVVGLKSGLSAFDPASGAVFPLRRFDEGHAGNRLNECKVDRHGRAWCSTMWDFGLRTTGALYRVDADLALHRVRDRITVPNAIAFSPDSRRVLLADTPTLRIEAGAFDLAAGEILAWSPFGGAEDVPGRPDGGTFDSHGYFWNARYGGGCLARFAPDGRLDRLVRLPVSQPSSCAFAGPELAELYVTTSRQGLSGEALRREPLAGSLLALDVGVSGLPEPAFAG